MQNACSPPGHSIYPPSVPKTHVPKLALASLCAHQPAAGLEKGPGESGALVESKHRDWWREMSWKISPWGPASVRRQRGQWQHPTLCCTMPCHVLGCAGFLHAELSLALSRPSHGMTGCAKPSWA